MTWTGALARAFTRPGRPRTAALGFILISIFLDVLALGIVIPVLPPLAQSLGGGSASTAAGALALFGSVFAAMTFVGSPFLGALSDAVGRRPVLLVSLFALGFDYLVMGFAPNLAWLFVGRVVAGLAGATGVVANAYVADTLPPDKRASAFAWGGAVWGLGFIVGPALGGWLGQFDMRLPFWCAAALTLVGALYGLVVLPESLPRERRTRFRPAQANPVAALGLLRSRPVLARLGVVWFLRWVAHSALATLFVLYIANRYGLGPVWAGVAVGVTGAFDVITQTLLVRPVIARVGERGAMLAGLGCGVAALAVLGLASTPWEFAAGLPLMAMVDLLGPGFMGIATRQASGSEQGRLQGAIMAVQTCGQIVGPAIFAATYAALETGVHPTAPGASFLIAAGIFALAFALASRLRVPGAES
ncbi:MAG TPA: MFS transporter [Caulobacteraceae bacterium]|jgi:DHA1 family tetracycline resistance protein-like MFS transporter